MSNIRDLIVDARRRQILKSAIGATALGASGLSFSTLSGTANSKVGDYKALVCVFLFGGNDSGNTLIPYDTSEFNRYVVNREGSINRPYGISRLRADLLALNAASVSGRQFALPKEMSALHELYGEGKVAIVTNTGLLAEPTSRQAYEAGTIELPPQLLSHSDQASFWLSGVPSYTTATGWGGRIVDRLSSFNSTRVTGDFSRRFRPMANRR
jgi:uncharacterized protein (DUF1501 family)